jgi:hypothetical protein
MDDGKAVNLVINLDDGERLETRKVKKVRIQTIMTHMNLSHASIGLQVLFMLLRVPFIGCLRTLGKNQNDPVLFLH